MSPACPSRRSSSGARCPCSPRCSRSSEAGRRSAPSMLHPRRQRPPAARPHAPVEGRDDPRDPPPGEEQPADDRVAAAAAGPPLAFTRSAGPRSPSRSAGSVRSRSCTRRCRASPATSCTSARSCGRWRALGRGDRRRRPSCGSASASTGDAGDLPGEVATPLAVVLNELMQNAVDHAFPEGTEGARGVGPVATRRRSRRRRGARQRRRPAGRVHIEGGEGLGLSIVHALVTGELGGIDRDAQRRRDVRVRTGTGGDAAGRVVANWASGARRSSRQLTSDSAGRSSPCAGGGAPLR